MNTNRPVVLEQADRLEQVNICKQALARLHARLDQDNNAINLYQRTILDMKDDALIELIKNIKENPDEDPIVNELDSNGVSIKIYAQLTLAAFKNICRKKEEVEVDIDLLHTFRMNALRLLEACNNAAKRSHNRYISALARQDAQLINADVPSQDTLARLEDSIQLQKVKLHKEKLNVYTLTEHIQDYLEDINATKQLIDVNEQIHASEQATGNALKAKNIYCKPLVSENISLIKDNDQSYTHIERVSISLQAVDDSQAVEEDSESKSKINDSGLPDAMIVTEYKLARNSKDQPEYQLVSNRILILNPKAKQSLSMLDPALTIEENDVGKTVTRDDVNERLNNEIRLKELNIRVSKLIQTEGLDYGNAFSILQEAKKLAVSENHTNWALLCYTLQDFTRFIRSKTTKARDDELSNASKTKALQIAYEEEMEINKRLNNSIVFDADMLVNGVNSIDEGASNHLFAELEHALSTKIEPMEYQQRPHQIVCAKLLAAIKINDSDNDNLKALKKTGRRAGRMVELYLQQHPKTDEDLQIYTDYLIKIENIVSNPAAPLPTFTAEEMKKMGDNDNRWAKIFLGAAIMALGLALTMISVAIAVVTLGGSSPLSAFGFSVGAALTAAGADVFATVLAIGIGGGGLGLLAAAYGFKIAFFGNKGEFEKGFEDASKAANTFNKFNRI